MALASTPRVRRLLALLPAAVHQRALRGKLLEGLRPRLAQASRDRAQHMSCRLSRKQGQCDDQVDHQLPVEFLLARFPGLLVSEHLIRICGQTYNLLLKDKLTKANAMLYDGTQIRMTDGLGGDDRFQHVQGHLLTQLVVEREMAYATRHEATPSCDSVDRFLQYVTASTKSTCHTTCPGG